MSTVLSFIPAGPKAILRFCKTTDTAVQPQTLPICSPTKAPGNFFANGLTAARKYDILSALRLANAN